jgi:hypothetical protein
MVFYRQKDGHENRRFLRPGIIPSLETESPKPYPTLLLAQSHFSEQTRWIVLNPVFGNISSSPFMLALSWSCGGSGVGESQEYHKWMF